jgi:hypothetical protein
MRIYAFDWGLIIGIGEESCGVGDSWENWGFIIVELEIHCRKLGIHCGIGEE